MSLLYCGIANAALTELVVPEGLSWWYLNAGNILLAY
jgi:hypothetical protein